MKLHELANHRVSYQVLVTFDLQNAESSKYKKIRDDLAHALELEPEIHMSRDDGGGTKSLPHNTLAALWKKDSTEAQTKAHIEERMKNVFESNEVTGRYVVLVGQNWSVAAGEF